MLLLADARQSFFLWGRLASSIAERMMRVSRLQSLVPRMQGFPIAVFGAAYAGLPFIPLNYRLGEEQLQPLVEANLGAVIIAETAKVPGADPAMVVLRSTLLDAEFSTAADVELPAFVDPEDVAIVLYTSGTSGTPKAALLRHRHLTAYVIGTVEFAGA
ncbi:MAG: AMP-binding protein, partial [Actinobacteria bacterium]|nr:AMP-binding protein [Actinomycetota bacterium]